MELHHDLTIAALMGEDPRAALCQRLADLQSLDCRSMGPAARRRLEDQEHAVRRGIAMCDELYRDAQALASVLRVTAPASAQTIGGVTC